MTGAPAHDELTEAEVAALESDYPGDMLRGFYDALGNAAWPLIPSPAYQYGRLGVIVAEQKAA